jgi:predicted MarR family transcription regulator
VIPDRGYYLAFLYYLHAEWEYESVKTLADVAEHFDIDIRLAMYYLKKLVREGLLCKIKNGRHTYYAHNWVAEAFLQVPEVEVQSVRRYKHHD